MTDGLGDTYVATRRQLRGVAEALIAGPQYRAAHTIRLAVRADGFAGVATPIAVRGADLVWPDGVVALAGPIGAIAATVGVDMGPPEGVYDVVDALGPDAVLDVDTAAADIVHRALLAGNLSLKDIAPEQNSVLWPEHFDVAVTEDEVNYGVSPGDDSHPTPYAYVGPWSKPTGEFWNAPFGAMYPLNPAHDVDALASSITDFFQRGRRELGK
ncbi:hypothetical protein DVS77_20220 [Mycolicibacterium moriokaense]|nr:hypothetical protein DVS77_20220 [Mycolicibacterium moriokaense]